MTVPMTCPGTAARWGTGTDTRSRDALTRYQRSMRVARIRYVSALSVAALLLLTLVTVAYSRGEIAHARLSTAVAPARPLMLQAPTVRQREVWSSRDRSAVGTPVWGGTLITYSSHGVRGRDARSGTITWSYARTDRRLCQAVQDQGVTVAIFEVGGNCDEVTALDSRTGTRRWTRTLDEDGAALTGHPTYSVTAATIMITAPTVIYAIDPRSGLDRWVYQPARCTISSAVLGSSGALISQRCDTPPCAGADFCGTGPQLLLRDAGAARDDNAARNRDQITWNRIGAEAIPLSAGGVLTAFDPASNAIDILAPATGNVRATLPPPAAGLSRSRRPITSGIADLAVRQADLVWIGGLTYALATSTDRLLWTRPTRALPTALTSGHLVAAPDAAGVALLDPNTGRVRQHFAIASGGPDAVRAYRLGSGFVIAGSATTVFR